MPNIHALGFQVSEKNIFKDFELGCHGNQTSKWNHILLQDHLCEDWSKYDQ